MPQIDIVLLLLCLVAASGILSQGPARFVPTALVQIGVGVAGALAGLHVGLDPALFMVVFLPPLLFADAFRMPLREFGQLRTTILIMAFGLVVLSTVLCGYAIHRIVPMLPLAVCFTVAAALSPTDTVAVSTLLRDRGVPDRLMNILAGEALFNDASGLVCFRFASAAALTGEFSYRQAFGAFLLVAFGGLAIGAGMAWVAVRAERFLLRRGFDDPPLQTTLITLLPFIIYITAEHCGGSGILAAVAGCMVIKLTGVVDEAATATRLRASTVMDMVSYVFNGLIFVLLGLQLPSLLTAAITVAHGYGASLTSLLALVLAVYGIMFLLRVAGVWATVLRRWAVARLANRPFTFPSIFGVALMTFAGVRGGVTLAAVLSLPAGTVAADLVSAGTQGAEAFPARGLVISIASGVIVVSLVAASIALPLCARFLPPEEGDLLEEEENRARQAMLRGTLDVLREEYEKLKAHKEGSPEADPLREEVVSRLTQIYESRLSQIDETPQMPVLRRDTARRRERIELALRLILLRTQRQILSKLAHDQVINDQSEWDIQRDIDYEEQLIRSRVSRIPQDI